MDNRRNKGCGNNGKSALSRGGNKQRGSLLPLARGCRARGSGGSWRRSEGWWVLRGVMDGVGYGERSDGTRGVRRGTEAALGVDCVAEDPSVAHLDGTRNVCGELLREGRVHVRNGVVGGIDAVQEADELQKRIGEDAVARGDRRHEGVAEEVKRQQVVVVLPAFSIRESGSCGAFGGSVRLYDADVDEGGREVRDGEVRRIAVAVGEGMRFNGGGGASDVRVSVEHVDDRVVPDKRTSRARRPATHRVAIQRGGKASPQRDQAREDASSRGTRPRRK